MTDQRPPAIPVFQPVIQMDTLRHLTEAFEVGWLGMGATTKMFEADLRDATRIDLARWQQRSLGDRLKERAARLFAYWL